MPPRALIFCPYLDFPHRDPEALLFRGTMSRLRESLIIIYMADDILSGAKIVWIEDDQFLSGMIAQRMGPTGANLINVTDGAKAFDVVKEEKPDIVLLDLLMPNVDGFEILRRIRTDEATKAIPVIVLSNLGQKEEIQRCEQLGIEEFVVKATIGLNEILPRIRSVLEKSKTA